jgi:arabinofuranosyltransferase
VATSETSGDERRVSRSDAPHPPPSAWTPIAAVAACAIAAVAHAAVLRWLSDDAFISFRYARNLVEGYGLVFNPGERVEGYTNPLWTLFIALGMWAKARPETWSIAWGIVCYAASIGLLGVVHQRTCVRLSLPTWLACIPFAAIAGAASVEWATFATSGLETSAFTMLVLAGLVAASERGNRPLARAAASGALLALATLTRPDGGIFAALAFTYMLILGAWRDALAFAVVFATLVVPFTAWRVEYYGSLLPNTYYAKSGDRTWWAQGLFYVRLYLTRHWLLAIAPLGLIPIFRRARPVASLALLSSAFALAYVAYVARVGGDFMFGRLLVPATPMLLVILDIGATLTASLVPRASIPIALLCAVAPMATPLPLKGDASDRGIDDERGHHTPERLARTRARGQAIAPLLEGLPAVVAIYGDEAALAYYGRIPVAIEAHAGLTDAFVAHLPLAQRGRVGHEKLAPLSYLVETRGAQLTFSKVPTVLLGLDAYEPIVHADLGGVRGRLLRWDPSFVAALRARGATVEDFPTMLDGLLAKLPTLTDAEVAVELVRCRRFYFDRVHDPAREAAFTERLARHEP